MARAGWEQACDDARRAEEKNRARRYHPASDYSAQAAVNRSTIRRAHARLCRTENDLQGHARGIEVSNRGTKWSIGSTAWNLGGMLWCCW